VSREHRIIESRSGLISIVGGKLTTYRAMGAEVVDRVAERLRTLDGRSVGPRAPTEREPLPGGEARDLAGVVQEIQRDGFSAEVAEHLVHLFGAEAVAVSRLARSDESLGRPIVPGQVGVRAELVHAMRREMAVTLCDLLIRRTHLFYEAPGHALAQAPEIVTLAARELGWDAARQASELAEYLQEVERSIAFRAELVRSPH
jgi:glycerol-3-phosphate dehydrogenase